MKVVGRGELQLGAKLVGRARAQAIEDVIVALVGTLHADARLLEQVVRHEAAGHSVRVAEVQLGEFAEAARVVVARRLGVAERLEQRIGYTKFTSFIKLIN